MGAVTDAPAVLLLVDDDEAKRYVIATWLRRAGHTVIEVATGREALDQVGAAELVLLDVNLPDISGYEVCRQIKGDPRTAAIPVIQVSATAVGASDKAQGLTQGADAYLVDPTEPEELLAVVAEQEREPGQVVETFMVLDATTGQNALSQAREFLAAADVTGIVLTKLDGTARGGIVVAIERDLGIPVKFVGVGEGVEDLIAFEPEAFVDSLLDT